MCVGGGGGGGGVSWNCVFMLYVYCLNSYFPICRFGIDCLKRSWIVDIYMCDSSFYIGLPKQIAGIGWLPRLLKLYNPVSTFGSLN